jgi:hypothetical protein
LRLILIVALYHAWIGNAISRQVALTLGLPTLKIRPCVFPRLGGNRTVDPPSDQLCSSFLRDLRFRCQKNGDLPAGKIFKISLSRLDWIEAQRSSGTKARQMTSTSDTLALLMDGYNASPKIVSGLLAEIATYGTASVKRI